MRGYPASGKSTRARQLADDNGFVVVSRDDLRRMLFGQDWVAGYHDIETAVNLVEGVQVVALLQAGYSVIADAPHLDPQFLRDWSTVADATGAELSVVDVHCDVAECVRRDSRREGSVGAAVIKDLAARYPVESWGKPKGPQPFG